MERFASRCTARDVSLRMDFRNPGSLEVLLRARRHGKERPAREDEVTGVNAPLGTVSCWETRASELWDSETIRSADFTHIGTSLCVHWIRSPPLRSVHRSCSSSIFPSCGESFRIKLPRWILAIGRISVRPNMKHDGLLIRPCLKTPSFGYNHPMSLQDEILSQGAQIKTDSYTMSIGELINLYRDNELDVHPEFQRVFRWSDSQNTRLIESILLASRSSYFCGTAQRWRLGCCGWRAATLNNFSVYWRIER